MESETTFEEQRKRMVDEQMRGRGIRDERVLEAMLKVPRHRFVPEKARLRAYEDRPLPIGQGQTISQPYVVALMTQLLEVKAEDKVLEIGTGSGFQSALLAFLAHELHTVERMVTLAEQAQSILAELGFHNVKVHVGDGSKGWPAEAPYDAIIVTAAAPHVPDPLIDQLGPDGRLVIPVGSSGRQILQKWWREDENLHHDEFTPVAFVPLIGEFGWGK